MPRSTMSVLSSSSSSTSQSSRNAPLPFTKSLPDFEVELASEPRSPQKSLSYSRTPSRGILRRTDSIPPPGVTPEQYAFQRHVNSLMQAKSRPFSICGHIPIDPKSLTLFFRSQSGIPHSLDFPIDVEVAAPSELDVLIAACKPHATCEMDGFSDRESLFYPLGLPFSTTLDLNSHPILDAIRSALFPRLATGQHLVAIRDSLELIPTGGHKCPQRRAPNEEGKVATLIVTLPVRYRGGALLVHNFEGSKERYFGRGGKPGDLEWTAFLSDCEHEIESVDRGVRLSISYNILLRTFGPSPTPSQALMLPSDRFLDFVAPILNMSRGRTIAFYLREQYGCSPSEVLAETLVPHLKGGDALLYHSLRLYKLLPELRWSAGGYVWPVDATVTCGSPMLARVASQPRIYPNSRSPTMTSLSNHSNHSNHSAHSSPKKIRHQRSSYQSNGSSNGSVNGGAIRRSSFALTPYRDRDSGNGSDSDSEEWEKEQAVQAARRKELELAINGNADAEAIRMMVESSGAVLLADAGIVVLSDESPNALTRERVPLLAAGSNNNLIVNILIVVFVP